MTTVRRAAVAGSFYPGTAAELDATVASYLSLADAATGPAPKAVIVPHAGFIYSGPVAAMAYARIKPAAGDITRVVLLGPCHRVAVRGLALSGARAFATPLGEVPVDADAGKMILELPQVQVFDAAHTDEHSLEVHLPFLQMVLGDFSVVPLVVGEATADEVAQVLETLWGGPETIIVVSTDLSHYLDYDSARRMDEDTCRAIEELDTDAIGRDQACGRVPVKGLLALAKRRGMKVTTLDLRNSGDTAGDRDRVVGYGAWMFTEQLSPGSRPGAVEAGGKAGEDTFGAETRALLKNHGPALLHLAAASIEHGLEHGEALPVNGADHAPELRRDGACFVTLKRNGKLRGCIGSSARQRPLVEDVAANGYAAAFKDPRFPALAKDELDGLVVSVSVLSPNRPMIFADEDDLLGQLRPGTDGLIIMDGKHRALFLPSVWESLPKREQFLGHLKVKAKLAQDHWSDDFKAWRFVAEEISSASLGEAMSLWSMNRHD